ncbi:hypothetical protein [Winogradskyella ursingii]|uniref:hypothetical protein n=1 Tax=Winogradskyella ursingii TaxID=2686079 RepID=UPI0015C9EEE3|nr:hypothetical protein [Winogradskyella ursingii]
MSQNSEKYYFIFEEWSMDPNQWSILIDSIAVLLAVFGVLIGFYLYRKQRNDNAKDAFGFFQASLPELIESLEEAITDLKEFKYSLNLDNFVNPVLSASLNDKFLKKINLVHLNRFYVDSKEDKLSSFKQLLIDSNFFGDYHSYISKEINYFRTNYHQLNSTFSKWRLLRSNTCFSTNKAENENDAYKKFYSNWLDSLNKELSEYKSTIQDKPQNINQRNDLIVNKIQNLSKEIVPFVTENQSANNVSLLAHNVISAYKEMVVMKAEIREVLEKDITRFEKVVSNMKKLLETK